MVTFAGVRNEFDAAKGVRQTNLRTHNLSLLLHAVRDIGPCSRPQLASRSGLSKVAVGRLVAGLLAQGLLIESGTAGSHGLGRPATALLLNDQITCIGVEVTADEVHLLSMDLSGVTEVIGWQPVPASITPEDMAVLIANELDRSIVKLQSDGRDVASVGIAVPALVTDPGRILQVSPSLGWSHVDLLALVDAQLAVSVPLILDNRANCAALAQTNAPSLRHGKLLVHIEVDKSIGAGLVSRGRIERGALGFAGALGHVPFDPQGPTCACGRKGCLEALAGFDAFLDMASPELRQRLAERQIRYSQALEVIVAGASVRDEQVLRALKVVGEWIGVGCATVINLLNPSVLTLGGYPSALAPWVFEHVSSSIDAHSIASNRGGCEILASMNESSVALGAATLALTQILNHSGSAADFSTVSL